MKKKRITFSEIKKFFSEMKKDFLAGKDEAYFEVCRFVNCFFILVVFFIIYNISIIIYTYHNIVGICMIAISCILVVVFEFWDTAFSQTIPISYTILIYLFGKYGQVVNKADWKWIRKNSKYAYKSILGKKRKKHCYYMSWALAHYLNDAKLMYCSVKRKNGQTGHCVVIKNGCVYDTTKRRHYDFDEYIKIHKAEIYKIFDEEVYWKESFFDDIRQDFVNWCDKRDVYCDPQ